MKYDPHGYQKHAIKFIIGQACAGLFLDPGLGKTSIMLAAFSLLKAKGMVSKMLVVAPLRPVYSVWPAEVQKWEDFHHLRVAIIHGPNKDEALRSDADVYVINPEGLTWLTRAAPRPLPWDVLVIDESTRFKHTTTQRFKTIKPMLPLFKRRYILTGSPAPNGLLDLFGQVYLLDLGHTLGQYITHFRINYFRQAGFGGYTWVPMAGSEQKIHQKLKPLVLRMAGEDFLDLPPLIENKVEVALPADAMKAYRQMETALLAALEDEVVVAANAAAAWGKCRQIANGGVFHKGGEEWSHVHEAKVDAVEEIIEELSGKPCLVAYEYRHDLDRLRRRLGGDTPYIGGGVPPSRFREIERLWNAGEIPVLLAQPQSVAHGLNLQGTGAAVIFHSLTPDLEVDEQFIRRVWRQGQKGRVIVHRVVAKDTVDEVLISMLRRKDRTQRALLDALKSHLRRKP